MTAMSAITAIFTALCLRPSARDPPGGKTFVDNKSQSALRPDGHRTVDALFLPFQGSNPVQFQPSFSVFTVRSAEGCGQFSFTQLPNYPFTQFCSDTKEIRQFPLTFIYQRAFWRTHTLGRCQTIACFFARINCESGHVLRAPLQTFVLACRQKKLAPEIVHEINCGQANTTSGGQEGAA
jgi:hypothetical protein